MVYDWADKEAECYQLYVEERLPLDRVMEMLRERHGFTASKRAFQTQFKRWDFPSKQNPAHKNAPLVARVKELWETNTSQKDMLRILNEEDFDIKERELMRVRAKNRWLLRVPNGAKSASDGTAKPSPGASSKRKREDESLHGMDSGSVDLGDPHDSNGIGDDTELDAALDGDSLLPSLADEDLTVERAEKRKQRLERLQADSDERWAAKKRRRRTRGWAGLPADPPGPPRFPSETTIDESKAYLHLTNDLYRQLRDQFTLICEEAGFVKKTIAGPEKWQAAKNRLILENPHLNNEFNGIPNGVPNENKVLALDVVCTDVTKRMRTLERRMTIPEAKNALGINPEESRQLRDQFYNILKADHFTSKLEAGDEHWKDLKQQWINESALLQQVYGLPNDDVEKSAKLKAIEVLCRDVMKRLRDDQTKQDPSRKRQLNLGPGPGPAPPKVASSSHQASSTPDAASGTPTMHAPTAPMVRPPVSSPAVLPGTGNISMGAGNRRGRRQNTSNMNSNANAAAVATAAAASAAVPSAMSTAQNDLQIDPSLLAAAANPMFIDQLKHYASEGQNYATPASTYQSTAAAAAAAMNGMGLAMSPPTQTQNTTTTQQQQQMRPVMAYFRRSINSPNQSGPPVWLGMLTSSSLSELLKLATREHPGADLLKIEGVVPDRSGVESLCPIDRDDELAAYLAYVAVRDKPTFGVHLSVGADGAAGNGE